MSAYNMQYPRHPNDNPYDKSERTVIVTDSNRHRYGTGQYSSNQDTVNQYNNFKPLNQDDNRELHNSNSVRMHNGWSSVSVTRPLKERRAFSDDDVSSVHTSTILSNPPTSPPSFHLVRNSSNNGPRVEAPNVNHLKADIYNIGVVMKSTITGAFDPDLFKVEAVAPTGRVIKIAGDGQYVAQFNADEIGRWNVGMYYNGKHLDGCPVDVCDPSQVKVRDLQGGIVGKSNNFHVDCTRAGPGDLGVDITVRGRPIPVFISPTATPGYKKVSFTPYELGPYEINVHFNKAEVREGDVDFFNPDERQRKALFFTRVEPHHGYINVEATCNWEVDYITGWPFICHVSDSSDIAVYGMEDGTVCAYPTLIADCTHVGDGRVTAEVTYNHQRYPCNVKRDEPGIYKVQFKPRGAGIYKVWINFEGQPVKGSPFIQEIADLEKPQANGDGLFRGILGKPANFTVDTRGFPGQVSVTVNGPSKPVNSQLEPQQNNTIRAVYYPTERGPHTVHVRVDGRDINGSPFRPMIVDPGNVRVSGGWKSHLDEKGVLSLRVNKEKHLPFDVSDAGQGELTSEVYGPNGKIPVTIDARKNGSHSVIFTPREEGKHSIHVNWGGFPLSNSPYTGYATFEPELEEPYNVRLVHVPAQSLERYPSSSMLNSAVDGPHRSSWETLPQLSKPTVVITRPKSPETAFNPIYNGAYNPEQTQTRVYNPERPQTTVYSPERPQTSVYNPEQTQTRVYNPERPQTSVYNPEQTQTRVYNPERPQTTVYNPERPQTRVQVLPVHTDTLKEPKFLNASPKKVQPDTQTKLHPPLSNGPQKVTLSGKGLKEAIVNKQARFTVDGSRASPGQPISYLKGNGDTVLVSSELLRPQVYKCTYVAKKPGTYFLYIDWNDKSLKGSPFKVDIKATDNPQNTTKTAATLMVPSPTSSTTLMIPSPRTSALPPVTPTTAENLVPEHGLLGKDLEMKIDSKYAKTGKLNVKCTDPQGKSVNCHIKNSSDGSKSVKIKPKMPGRYNMQIIHNGDHIQGSPFTIDIRGSHGVKVWGPGIENGVIPYFQGNFWVDTTGAKAGEMRVKVEGPKGAFHVKIRKASQKDKVYQCFYDPVEPGVYIISVQWSGKHVGGSPYTVLLTNSMKELQSMQEEIYESSVANGDDSSVVSRILSKKYPAHNLATDDVILY